MRLTDLALSANIIDVRAMLHLMPDEFQRAIDGAQWSGFWAGAACALGLMLAIAMMINPTKGSGNK